MPSTDRWINKCNIAIQRSIITHKGMHAISRTNLENVMLSTLSQIQISHVIGFYLYEM